MKRQFWVPGWIYQGTCLIFGVASVYMGREASAWLAASFVIGAMRMIEKERRKDG